MSTFKPMRDENETTEMKHSMLDVLEEIMEQNPKIKRRVEKLKKNREIA